MPRRSVLGETLTPEVLDADPYPVYARLRRTDPVAWAPHLHAHLVTRWDDVVRVARDDAVFSADVTDSPLTRAIGHNMLHGDGAFHHALRAPLTQGLRPGAVAGFARGVIEPAVADLAARLADGAIHDLVADVAQPLAVRTLQAVSGLPPMSADTFVAWVNGIGAGASNYERDPVKQARADRVCAEVDSVLRRELERGPHPGTLLDGLAPLLGTPGIGFEEIASSMKLLIIGGMQEPRDLFGYAMIALLTQPGVRDAVVGDPAGVGRLVEEALRWGSPVGTVTRRVVRSVELGDVPLEPGDVVAGVIASANRDERHWPEPDAFDLYRDGLQHIAFSAGYHACVGAMLARAEVGLAVEAMVAHFPDMRLVEAPVVRGWEFRGPTSLRVEPGPRRTVVAGPPKTRALPPPLRLRVTAVAHDGPDVAVVSLAGASGAALPPWTAGAHIDVRVPMAPDGAWRSYSLCGVPGDPGWRIAVRRVDGGRGASAWLHERLAVGDTLEAKAPRNTFSLVDAPRYLLIAGGIGITPLLPMVDALARRGRPWHLLYVGSRRERMPFLPDLATYGAAVRVWETGQRGRPDLGAMLVAAPADTTVYCCGPESLVEACEAIVASAATPWALRVERFRPRPGMSASRPGDRAFDVELARSGERVRVGPDETVLAALERADVVVPSTCREGICGSCETVVLAGAVDHRDAVLTDGERRQGRTMLVCVSRARADALVLDL